MKELLVLAEHRRGKLKDTTLEMLCEADKLATQMASDVVAVLLGWEVEDIAKLLVDYADKVLVVKDKKLENFNSEYYQRILSKLVSTRKPILLMIAHTSFGMDLAPALAVELNLPLITDCLEIKVENSLVHATRQMYGGKVNAEITIPAPSLATVRPAAFGIEEGRKKGKLIWLKSPLKEDLEYKKFIEYVEAAVGKVDITQAEVLVAIGRGVKEKDNLPIIEQLAETLGGVLACSRPIVDKKWLTPNRQVGTSGKTVKPKLYLAIGISGAFQHVAGMKGADTIIAINKDPNAPIFEVADYGIADDLFKVVPMLIEKIKESRR